MASLYHARVHRHFNIPDIHPHATTRNCQPFYTTLPFKSRVKNLVFKFFLTCFNLSCMYCICCIVCRYCMYVILFSEFHLEK